MNVYGAYQFTFLIPELWAGHALSFHFDMFDNQDNLGSLAYGGITIIPEPAIISLVFLGFAAGRYFRGRLSAAAARRRGNANLR